MLLHCVPGVAVSAQAGGLLPLSQQSSIILPHSGYHDYRESLRDEEKPRPWPTWGLQTVSSFVTHGLLTVGETVGDAFITMFGLIKACEIRIGSKVAVAGDPINQAILDGVSANIDAVTMGMGEISRGQHYCASSIVRCPATATSEPTGTFRGGVEVPATGFGVNPASCDPVGSVLRSD